METALKQRLVDNLKRIEERIAAACEQANRPRSAVRMIAVTKYVHPEVIEALLEAGCADIGESRVQALAERVELIADAMSVRMSLPEGGGWVQPRWHMVGHLQRNKVKQVLPYASLLHSVDSLRLAEEIDAQARRQGRTADILMQVNAGAEESKFGVAVGAATHLAENIATLPNINLCGLMTMAPNTDDRGVVYDCFNRCYELYDEITHEVPVGEHFHHLSMGMSGDFEIAIATGATLIRIGSALFEGLPTTRSSVDPQEES